MRKFSYFLLLSVFIAFAVISCEKSEVDQIDSTSQESDLTIYTPLKLDQIISFLEDMNIDESSWPTTGDNLRMSDLVEASYVVPGLNIAGASNGESFGVSGFGDLTLHPKSVCGGGAWVHYDTNGEEIASGSWEVEQLMSFLDYGPSPVFPPEAQFIHAGKSIMRIHLGAPANVDAILTIYCILPEVQTPPSWPEGIKISLQNGGPNFNQVLTGGTFFALPWFPLCSE